MLCLLDLRAACVCACLYYYCCCCFQFQVCPKSLCVSTPGHRTDLFQRDPKNVLITDFFGSVRKVEITTEKMCLQWASQVVDSRYLSYYVDRILEDALRAEGVFGSTCVSLQSSHASCECGWELCSRLDFDVFCNTVLVPWQLEMY